MIKNILAAIGALVLVSVIGGYIAFGGVISKVSGLDSKALPAYMDMFNKVLETGDAAKAMVLEYKVDDDIPNEDVVESIKTLAEEYNMRITGDIKMFTLEDAKGKEVKHARIISLCSLPIAKKFLNFSHQYGAFMPCRIILLELANGERYLYTMDLTLMIYGGKSLSPDMLKMAKGVQEVMHNIPNRAIKGDF
jgi:uncharacterized protein (DUF302 family)